MRSLSQIECTRYSQWLWHVLRYHVTDMVIYESKLSFEKHNKIGKRGGNYLKFFLLRYSNFLQKYLRNLVFVV